MNASRQQPAGAVGGVEGRGDLFRVPRERLLAEHVLAGLERLDRPLDVHRVRQRDVDGLDVGIGEQGLVRAVRARNLPLARVRVGPRLVAARDREQIDLVRRVRSRNDLPVDVGGRDDSPFHYRTHTRTISHRGCDRRRHARVRVHGQGPFECVPEDPEHHVAAAARAAADRDRRPQRARPSARPRAGTAGSTRRPTGATSSPTSGSGCSTTAGRTRSTPSRRSRPPGPGSTSCARSRSGATPARATRSGSRWPRRASSTCARSTTASSRPSGSRGRWWTPASSARCGTSAAATSRTGATTRRSTRGASTPMPPGRVRSATS